MKKKIIKKNLLPTILFHRISHNVKTSQTYYHKESYRSKKTFKSKSCFDLMNLAPKFPPINAQKS